MTAFKTDFLSRRRFFKQAGALTATGVLAGEPLSAAGLEAAVRQGRAKQIIFMVSDGMSHGTLAMADQLRLLSEGRSSHWMRMYRERPVVRALMDTSSADNRVTDSAAASSAWGGGVKVPNGRLNVSREGEEMEPILLRAKRQGLRTGVVTTATVTHATPAGFIANSEDRNRQEDIARQYLEREVDVILGGGLAFFDAQRRGDGADLAEQFAEAGWLRMESRDGLRQRPPGSEKLLGLFAQGHLPFEVDRLHDEALRAQVPSLAEMTAAALETLSRGGRGFLVQIEGARVDHAAHNNDISGLLGDQLAFDDAISVALDFCDAHPETLLLVTTDHGNANPGLNSGGMRGAATLGRVRQFTGSLTRMNETWPGIESLDVAGVQAHVRQTTGLALREAHAEIILARLREAWPSAYRRMGGITGVVGQVIANEIDVGWVGNSHTSDAVELAAIGPGSERIRPWMDNTELHAVMTGVLAL